MTWASELPQLLVAAAVVYLPGLLALAPARLAPLARLALASLVGVGVLAGSALAAAVVGGSWSWPWVLGGALLAAGALAVVRWRRPTARPPVTGAGLPVLLHYLAGMVLAALMLGPSVIRALGSPDFFAQRHDNVFHLNAIRFVAETGQGSPFGFASIGSVGFYPPAWYDWGGLTLQLTQAPIRTVLQAITVVTIFVIWPLSLAWLAESSLPISNWGRLLLGPLALSSVSFPLSFLDWGPLFPNLLGLALAPVLIAAGWHGLGLARAPRLGLAAAVTLLIIGIATTMLAHPNATLTAGLLLVPVAVRALWRARRQDGSGRRWIRGSRSWTALVALAIVAFPVAWVVAAGRLADIEREGFMQVGQALGDVALGSSLGKPVVWPITIGLLIGVIVAARMRRAQSLLVGFIVLGLGYIATTTLGDQPIAALFAAPFYNDPYRVGAVLALPTLLLVVLGWDVSARWVGLQLRRGSGRGPLFAGSRSTRSLMQTLLALALASGLAVGTLLSPGWTDSTVRVQQNYRLDQNSDILTPDELTLIERLPQHVPPDAVVATNPWHGGALVYAFADRQVTQFYMTRVPNADVQLINDRLNLAATDANVCAALQRTGTSYALVLEPHVLWSVRQEPPNLGLTGLDRAAGFELVDSQGGAALYRITACD